MTGAVPARALARLTTILGSEFSREDVKRIAPRLLPHIDDEPGGLRTKARALLEGLDPLTVRASIKPCAATVIVDPDRKEITFRFNDHMRAEGRALFRDAVNIDGAPLAFQALVGDDARLDALVDDVQSAYFVQMLKDEALKRAGQERDGSLAAFALAAVVARATACALAAPVTAGGREGAIETNTKRRAATNPQTAAILAAWATPEMQRLPSDRARCARLKTRHKWSRGKIMRALGAEQPTGK